MNNQDALFPIVKDDITFDTLLAQAKTVIEQQSGQGWSNMSASDPGITLLEVCCYGASDLAYRHSLPLKDLLTPKSDAQVAGDGIFPQEFGPQQMLTCGPITAEDYRRALLDLHSSDSNKVNETVDESSTGYFLFNDVQLICEPKTESYAYWYDKEKRAYRFTSEENSNSEKLTLRGNYWLYLLPSREMEADKKTNKPAQDILNNFLKNNRNLGESVSKVIWLKPVELPLQIEVELDDDVSDIAGIFAQIYMTTEQMVQAKPERHTTQSLQEQGYSNEEIFSGPYLRHGWIPELPPIKDYAGVTTLNLSHLVNQLLAIKGVQNITRLALGLNGENSPISPLSNDKWSWNIAQEYYPRLWGDNPLALITSLKSPLKITVKGGVVITVSQQQVEEKIIFLSLINTQPVLLNWGKHRKVQDYSPMSNKIPACYGLQSYAKSKQQEQLHQFMLPFEQMLANGCAELDLLPELLAFKQRGNNVYGAQWPFKADTVNRYVHQEIMPDLLKKLENDAQIGNTPDINQKNYTKELDILNYLLGYFGTQCAIRPLIANQKEFLSTQRSCLAQQPELTYQRHNIRIDKVSALQKRIAARIGLGGECFKETPDLGKLPFYLIEHRQLLPIKPDSKFDAKQKPDVLKVNGDQIEITQEGIGDHLSSGQVINIIIIDDITLRGQMITQVTGNTFCLNTKNSTDLKQNLKRIQKAFEQNKLCWQNSPVWMEDMDYQLIYASEDNQQVAEDEKWIISDPKTPFPAMIGEGDEITLEYKIISSDANKYFNFALKENKDELKAHIIKADRIDEKILIKRNKDSQGHYPSKEEARHYCWYFSKPKDRFSFVVSAVFNKELINEQLIKKENTIIDTHQLRSWIETEVLSEFPAHVSVIIHWLSARNFNEFSDNYKRWQNNGTPLGDEAYSILEILTLGRLPSALIGINNMRIASQEQQNMVVGPSGTEWNSDVIKENQLLFIPKN
ncbi:hypothetical protein [Xenorhabdus bovienii]|uniref:hypothetical protein n=1 Tax=Xenorhabdus bovienii TaxID=40576 RepID=UPI00237CBD6E|nr:hypothetical protein [Xenorhabdus bovienii]MDE1482849.1 hypothetical protein [Xenorhabdus bovienii]MDE9441804.1 hypothetical protein [Xenorhabdus bovienii]